MTVQLPIVGSYELTVTDLRRAQLGVLLRSRAVLGIYAVLLFSFFAVVLPAILEGRERVWDIRFIVVFGSFFVFIPLLLWWSPVSQVRSLKPEQRVRRFSFDPEGFTTENDLASTRVSWRAVIRAAQGQKGLFLYVHKMAAHYFPARAFQSSSDVVEVLALYDRYRDKAP